MKKTKNYLLKNKGLLIIASISLIFLVAVGLLINNSLKNKNKDVGYCEKDADCTTTDDGCCGCNYGGKAISINKKYFDYWNEKLRKECVDIFCPAVISNDWTCFAESRCVNNKCELR